MLETKKNLVLASGSGIRKTLLENAGLIFEVIPADIDEEKIRNQLEADTPDITPLQIADKLAEEKAKHISSQMPDAFVIGSDQILALEREIFAKPANIEEARKRIEILSGKTHQLHTSVAVAHAGDTVWCHGETVNMTMRELSTEFISKYISAAGEEICKSVGAYKLEGLGIRLFSAMEGNYFSILGICLLPLLEYLRDEEIIES